MTFFNPFFFLLEDSFWEPWFWLFESVLAEFWLESDEEVVEVSPELAAAFPEGEPCAEDDDAEGDDAEEEAGVLDEDDAEPAAPGVTDSTNAPAFPVPELLPPAPVPMARFPGASVSPLSSS